MRAHMSACAQCARHDALIRRSLFLVKNLTPIEPSPGFRARLDARLREAAAQPRDLVAPSGMSFVQAFVLAAAVVVVAVIANEVRRQPDQPLQLPPVVASAPEYDHSPLATPALVATVPTGMSVWPAIMAASQVPVHFVATEMETDR